LIISLLLAAAVAARITVVAGVPEVIELAQVYQLRRELLILLLLVVVAAPLRGQPQILKAVLGLIQYFLLLLLTAAVAAAVKAAL
jgi:hypothetical protein